MSMRFFRRRNLLAFWWSGSGVVADVIPGVVIVQRKTLHVARAKQRTQSALAGLLHHCFGAAAGYSAATVFKECYNRD